MRSNTKELNMKKMICVLLPALMLFSCSKDSEGRDDYEGQIEIVTGIEALTRSPELDGTGAGNFRTGDVFTLTVSDNIRQMQRLYEVGTTALYWQDFGNMDETVSFAGCYPVYEPDDDGCFKFEAAKTPAEDLLLAKAVQVAKGSAKVSLPFRHALHKLVVKYVSDGSYADEALNGVETTLLANASCRVNPVKGEIENNSATGKAAYPVLTGKEVSCLLVPQNKDDVSLAIKFAGKAHTYTLPDKTNEGQVLTELESGKMLTVTLRITGDGILFEGMDIGQWDQQGSIEGSIEM